jgi:small redox-active disulfide protein 2
MEIKVLGTGCARCKNLEQSTRQAAQELSLNAVIEKVEDMQKIMEYGIMRTPGLVVDGKVILSGQVPRVDELKILLAKYM